MSELFLFAGSETGAQNDDTMGSGTISGGQMMSWGSVPQPMTLMPPQMSCGFPPPGQTLMPWGFSPAGPPPNMTWGRPPWPEVL